MPNDLVDNIFGDTMTAGETAVETVSEPAPKSGPTGEVQRPPTGNAARQIPAESLNAKDPNSVIADLLLGDEAGGEEPAAETKETDKGPTRDPETGKFVKSETTAEAPATKVPFHSTNALQYASANGIGPDEAMQYPTERALVAEATLRKVMRDRNAGAAASPAAAKTPVVEEFKLPEIKLPDDVDPSVKPVLESLAQQNKLIKEYADKHIAALSEENKRIRAEQEKAQQRESQNVQLEVSRMFDEEVESWGDEYKELLGTPTKSLRDTGTQGEEFRKLNEYVVERMLGYEVNRGEPTPKESVELQRRFLREGRLALWPELAVKTVKAEVARNLKNQKGGVALKASKARVEEPPEQGDGAALAAITDQLNSLGMNPYFRKAAR